MTISDLIELLEYLESKNQESNEKQEEKFNYILDEIRALEYDFELIKEKLKIKDNLYWVYQNNLKFNDTKIEVNNLIKHLASHNWVK